MNDYAIIFPGQGSQSIGMGFELASMYQSARKVYDMADEWLGFSLSNISWHGPETELNDTANTQPALFVHSIAALTVIKEHFPTLKPKFVAGHSMGELSALVASGTLGFMDALNLVRRRGELMKKAGQLNPGGMAALLGLDLDKVEEICNDASQGDEVVQIANDNCPKQVVISGSFPSLERAIKFAEKAGARRIIKLAVSIAAHSPLMKDAQVEFNSVVDDSPFITPQISMVGNVNATPLSTIQQIKSDLKSQLSSRVRWTETINFMINEGTRLFIEVGNGSVLSGLVKRINNYVIGVPFGNPSDFENLNNFFSQSGY